MAQKSKRGRPTKWKLIQGELAVGDATDLPEGLKLGSARTLVYNYNKAHPETFYSVREAARGRYKVWRVR